MQCRDVETCLKSYVDRELCKIHSLVIQNNHCQPIMPSGRGQKGQKGDKGEQGARGSLIFTGTTNPEPNNLLAVAARKFAIKMIIPGSQNGDLFINTLTDAYFLKINDVWILQGNLKGDIGEKGEQGVKGDVGEKGEQGVKGDVGEKGEQGVKGDVGEKGEQGVKGDIGEKGEQGEKGDVGEKGEQGIKGDIGEKGEQGVKGDIGEKGEQGVKGDIGEKGEQGVKGDIGEKGEQGVKGDIGEKGEQGVKGDIGEKGEQGVKGDIGEKGEQGVKGEASSSCEIVNVDGTSVSVCTDGIARTQADLYTLATAQGSDPFNVGNTAGVNMDYFDTATGVKVTGNFRATDLSALTNYSLSLGRWTRAEAEAAISYGVNQGGLLRSAGTASLVGGITAGTIDCNARACDVRGIVVDSTSNLTINASGFLSQAQVYLDQEATLINEGFLSRISYFGFSGSTATIDNTCRGCELNARNVNSGIINSTTSDVTMINALVEASTVNFANNRCCTIQCNVDTGSLQLESSRYSTINLEIFRSSPLVIGSFASNITSTIATSNVSINAITNSQISARNILSTATYQSIISSSVMVDVVSATVTINSVLTGCIVAAEIISGAALNITRAGIPPGIVRGCIIGGYAIDSNSNISMTADTNLTGSILFGMAENGESHTCNTRGSTVLGRACQLPNNNTPYSLVHGYNGLGYLTGSHTHSSFIGATAGFYQKVTVNMRSIETGATSRLVTADNTQLTLPYSTPGRARVNIKILSNVSSITLDFVVAFDGANYVATIPLVETVREPLASPNVYTFVPGTSFTIAISGYPPGEEFFATVEMSMLNLSGLP